MSKHLLFVFLILCLFRETCFAQDRLPALPPSPEFMKPFLPLLGLERGADTISIGSSLPTSFLETRCNEIIDTLGMLVSVLEHLRLVKATISEDTVRILHIGDSHIRGHIYPQTAGQRLAKTFGAISYTDMGINGATCLTFTHPDRIAAIAAQKPELLIMSFGTNESHNKSYNAHLHYQQMHELISLIRDSLPDVPILLTTPPGSYERFRQRRRNMAYAINPRTVMVVNTIQQYARDHNLMVWDVYNVVGGNLRACRNWQEAGLMRPDHVHYMFEGYILQGNLLYEAIIKAYNDYVSH